MLCQWSLLKACPNSLHDTEKGGYHLVTQALEYSKAQVLASLWLTRVTRIRYLSLI